MANLMQLGFNIDSVMMLIQENDGVLTPETEKQLAVLQKEITAKVDNVGLAIVLKQKEIEGLKNFEYAIAEKRRSLENSLSRFKLWLTDCVQSFGSDQGYTGKVLKGKVVTIKDDTKEKLTFDVDRVPADFKTEVLTLKIPCLELSAIKNKQIKNFIEKYLTKESIEVNTKDRTPKDEGFGHEVKKSVTFLGLKKLDTNTQIEG
jgi:uncharacterized protein (UPF0335 family)